MTGGAGRGGAAGSAAGAGGTGGTAGGSGTTGTAGRGGTTGTAGRGGTTGTAGRGGSGGAGGAGCAAQMQPVTFYRGTAPGQTSSTSNRYYWVENDSQYITLHYSPGAAPEHNQHPLRIEYSVANGYEITAGDQRVAATWNLEGKLAVWGPDIDSIQSRHDDDPELPERDRRRGHDGLLLVSTRHRNRHVGHLPVVAGQPAACCSSRTPTWAATGRSGSTCA